MTIPATWTEERVEQLRDCINAGLTCSQIAGEIGVSRNAVIGKIHRLGLAPGRPAATPRERLRGGEARGPRRRFTQSGILRALFAQAPPRSDVAAAPMESAARCSLFELKQGKCRWPISDPGEADFGFCGNDAMRSMSYCAGHARMAYNVKRSAAR
jgi:GcrA cell cycle regulator